MPCLCKQCRSWLVGFCTTDLDLHCLSLEFVATTWIKLSDWLKTRSGCGINFFSRAGVIISGVLYTGVKRMHYLFRICPQFITYNSKKAETGGWEIRNSLGALHADDSKIKYSNIRGAVLLFYSWFLDISIVYFWIANRIIMDIQNVCLIFQNWIMDIQRL